MVDGSYVYVSDKEFSWLAKSALAFLKIRQLIEDGYGGNVTNEEWRTAIDEDNPIYIITIDGMNNIRCGYVEITQEYSPIAFHTKEQAEEFLSDPERVQLLKDYFMIEDKNDL